jgi:hypothetical protein
MATIMAEGGALKGTEPDSDASESGVVDQRLQRQLVQAQINREEATREALRTGARERRRKVDKGIDNEKALTDARIANENKLATAQVADLDRLTEAKLRDRRKRTAAKIADRESWTKADIADQRRRTRAEMEGLERRDKTWQAGQYFWMAVTALGLAIFAVLAFLTAGHSLLEYRLSPAAGLLITAGGGYQVHVLLKRVQDEPADEKKGKRRKAKGSRR